MVDRVTARGLARFGIGLGEVELLASHRLAKTTGLAGDERTLRLFGAREIVSGAIVLGSDEPERRLGVRVAGDVLDGGPLSLGLSSSDPDRSRTALADLAVAPVVALDLAVWLRARAKPSRSVSFR